MRTRWSSKESIVLVDWKYRVALAVSAGGRFAGAAAFRKHESKSMRKTVSIFGEVVVQYMAHRLRAKVQWNIQLKRHCWSASIKQKAMPVTDRQTEEELWNTLGDAA
jgi:hypothetical protein